MSLKRNLMMLLSGLLVPLHFLPSTVAALVDTLPFALIAYYPTMAYVGHLGRDGAPQFAFVLLAAVGWWLARRERGAVDQGVPTFGSAGRLTSTERKIRRRIFTTLAALSSAVTLPRDEGDGVTRTACEIDRATLDAWSAPYRGWHYFPTAIIPSDHAIPGHEKFQNFDVPTVYQIPGQTGTWFMSYIGFDGAGYNSFVAESTDLVRWTNPRLAMGFGKEGEFDFGGCVVGAYLYETYDVKAPRLLKKRDGRFWTLYGCYAKQGGYELDPGYEGVANSDDGLTWRRAQDRYILSIHEPEVGEWEKHCIYQPWLVEHEGRFLNFYNAKHMPDWIEQMGMATSRDLLTWKRHADNPIIRVRPGGYDEKFCADGKVFRDGDHWVMFYFGVGRGGAHIMAAFSRDLLHWTAHPEPLYRAGGHPGGLDTTYAHKISLVYHPGNDTYYLHYCAVGTAGRIIALITSRPLSGT